MENAEKHKFLYFQIFLLCSFLGKFMDFNGETETLVFCFFAILMKTHRFYLGNRDPGFHFCSVFEMDNGICKYRK